MRRTLRKAVPGAVEKISYGIPAYALSGNVVYFAGYANYVGLYPAPTGNAAFEKAIARYRSGKATLRFPLDEPLPLDLIAEAVRLRVEANRDAAAVKTKAKEKAK
jgi:uncharacterized protein YdhG (YjbR/CyaY superfamily)